MPSYSTSTPQAVYRGTTAPSAADYSFFIDSATNEAFFSDGSTWTEIPTGASSLNVPVSENSLAIIELQAAGTIAPDISANFVRDVFTDSSGYLNTINTGVTTATFSTNLYTNNITGGTDANPNATTQDYSGSQTAKFGMQFTMTAKRRLTNVSKRAEVTATKCYLQNSDGSSNLATADFSGNNAIFDYTLSSGTTYRIVYDNDGAAFQPRWDSASYPDSGTSLNWIKGIEAGTETTGRAFGIDTLTFSAGGVDGIVQTEMQTLSSTPTYFQLFAFKEAATNDLTADISFNNGTNYQTGLSFNTAYEITNTGTEMILKLNFNGGTTHSITTLRGYGVLFW